jgi:hypothetical protein
VERQAREASTPPFVGGKQGASRAQGTKAPASVSAPGAHPKNRNTADEEVPFPVPGKILKQSCDSGERIPSQSQRTQENMGHGHSPRVPWPQGTSGPYQSRGGASGVPHTPFKFTK